MEKRPDTSEDDAVVTSSKDKQLCMGEMLECTLFFDKPSKNMLQSLATWQLIIYNLFSPLETQNGF